MKKETMITKDSFKDAEEYWLGKLSGELNEMKILGDFPGSQTYEVGNSEFVLEEYLKDELARISKNNDLSLYIILLSILKILLFKYTEQTNIIVASPIYTPENSEFNRYVILKDEIAYHMVFKELLIKIKETVVDAYKNEHFPLNNLVDFLVVSDLTSLCRITILLENIHQKELVGDLQGDLVFSFRKTDSTLELDIRYNSRLFRKETIENVFLYYCRILSQVVSDTKKEIGKIQLMTEDEKKHIVFHLNNTTKEYPKDKTIQQLFEQQAAKTPTRIAVSAGLDLSDVYEELISPRMNPNLFSIIKRCCFKINPYIYKHGAVLPGNGGNFYLLKTHRHNSVVVNENMLKLLNLFDGGRNVKSIFSALEQGNFKVVIYPVKPDDVLEISVTFGEKEEFHLSRDFEDFVGVIKTLFKNHLLELESITSHQTDLKGITRGYFHENGPKDIYICPDKIVNQSGELSRAQVLFLGDTPGMPSVGLLYLASYLRRNGIKCYCQFSDLNWRKTLLEKNLQELLRTIQPEILAISLKWFLHIARVKEICKIVKSYSPHIKVVVGGNTASYYAEELIRDENIDYIVKGDGEEPLLEICRESDYIPNCIYKKDGKIINNPITYVQDKSNSSGIYLSHLDEILFSRYASIFGTFLIYTHKGCGMNCIYCGGCREAQTKVFNRPGLFLRPAAVVRKDIIEAKKYTSTFMFDFDYSNKRLAEFCREIWEGIDLTSHFCIFTNLIPPTPELVKLVNKTFKYVYWNLDIASLSEKQRMQLAQLGLVKPQLSDEEIFTFFDNCEKFPNNEIRINTIAGLPYFTPEDIAQSENLLSHLIENYSCMSELHWARLHAQPGAPIAEDAPNFQMHSNASTFKEFLTYSKQNFDSNTRYPDVENFVYPYIYFNDDRLNSRISQLYSVINNKIDHFLKERRKKPLISEKITYQQLSHSAHQLAARLRSTGVTTDSIVGIIVGASIEMVIGILGILTAGGAYLPIDTEFPQKRIDYMLEDSGASVLVTTQTLAGAVEKVRSWHGKKVYLDEIPGTPANPIQPLNLSTSQLSNPSSLAYVIYTSGTTGKPKGVLVEHKGVINYTCSRLEAYRYTRDDRTLQLLSFSFDGFCSNFYSGLLSGGTLYMVPDSRRIDFNYIRDVIHHNRITNISLVPGMYRALFDVSRESDIQSLRFVVLAGEKADTHLIRMSRQKNPHILLINEYGPTETTVTAAINMGMAEDNTAVIGTPIPNVQVYILDRCLNHVPMNIPGELCISGIGVSRGYLNRPELNIEKFGPNPFIPGERIYHSGDMARRLPDGNIEYLGRIDHQVKIRGFRIELREIEALLLKHDLVKDAVVIDREDEIGQEYLCAYIVWERDFDLSGLRDYLAGNLPAYMIPSYFINIKKMPVTPNGKLDRKALPPPGATVKEEYTAPGNETEEKLVNIWSEVLNVDKEVISIDSNFFELGGHSLKATVMTTVIEKELSVKVPLTDIFRFQTIRLLSDYIRSTRKERFVSLTPVEKKEYYSMSSAQKRIFIWQQMNMESVFINSPSAIELTGALDRQRFEEAFPKLIQRHESLRTSFHFIEEEYLQKIHPGFPFEIEYFEVGENAFAREEAHEIRGKFVRPFDLQLIPLFRVGLVEMEMRHHLLIVDMHHIINDAVSSEVFFKDLMSLYDEQQLVPLLIQYKDFAQWQNEFIKSGGMNKQKEYWLKVFEKDVPVINLSTDFARPDIITLGGDYLNFEIDKEDTEASRVLASQEDATLFMVVLAVISVLLAKDSGQEDIVVGSPVACRRHEDTRRIIGVFSNFLALRNYPNKEKTFREFLKEVKQNALMAIENQEYPFEELVKAVSASQDRDSTRNPLFDIIFAFQNMNITKIEIPGIKLETAEFDDSRTVRYDLEFHGFEGEENLFFKVGYKIKLFKEETVKKLIESFKNVFKLVVKNPDIKLADIEVVSEKEKEQIIFGFNTEMEKYYEF